jgi:hypothetical protein
MPRTLSPAAAQSALAQQTGEVWIACLTVSGDGLDTLRIATDNIVVERTAGPFSPYPFEVELPEDAERGFGTATLRIDNIDREVCRLLRDYSGVPVATVEVVLASQPDTVELGPFEMTILSGEADELTIQLGLGHEEDILNQRVPAQSYFPSNSQGLWP